MSQNHKHFQSLLNWERLDDVYYRSRPLMSNQKTSIPFTFDDSLLSNSDVSYDITKSYFFDLIAEISPNKKSLTVKSLGQPSTVLYTVSLVNHEWDHEDNEVVAVRWDHDLDTATIYLIAVMKYNIIVTEFNDSVNEYVLDFINDNDSTDEVWTMKENNIILSKNQQSFYQLDLKKRTVNIIYENNTSKDGYAILDNDSWIVNKDNNVIILSENKILLLNSVKGLKILKTNIHFDKGCFSYSNSFLSLFNNKQQIMTIFAINHNSTNLRQLVDIKLSFNPKLIRWVSNDCIATLNEQENEVVLFGPTGSNITFWYNDENKIINMVTCLDGVKLYTRSQQCFLISKIENVTKNLFQVGSTHESSILSDCFEMYQEGQISKVLPVLENLNLTEVVLDVIEASLEEFDPLVQKRLLSCATWGKSSMLIGALKDSNTDIIKKMNSEFEQACQKLRIFNNIKDCLNYRITYKEFKNFGIKRFIKMLINRPECHTKNNKRPILNECLKLAFYLKDYNLVVDILLIFLARKIKLNDEKSDDELFKDIEQLFETLNMDPNKVAFPFSALFSTCIEEKRIDLAKNLIFKDPVLKRHIVPLLELNKIVTNDEENLYLNEVLVNTLNKVGDSFLLLYALYEYKKDFRSSRLAKFLMMNDKNLDLNLFFRILEKTELSPEQFGLSYEYYIQMDEVINLLNLIKEKDATNQVSKNNTLTQFDVIYRKNTNNYSNQSLKCHSIIKRDLKLSTFQQEIYDEFKIDVNGKTLNDTLSLLILYGNKNLINKFVNMFNISGKQLYLYECLSCIATSHVDIERILVLSSQRKNSKYLKLTYKKLIELKYFNEASKMINLPNNEWPFEEKFNSYIECKRYEQALELAEYHKDDEAIEYVTQLLENSV
ncbi:uncharacterized protein HGUI_01036 [Hanseniaspora guilliermondii]|uniref:Vacuolar protein sorting-associated protein 16 homolog n=1 Tax=Hanseniaspora guilliermondii TaxID=56406 RepID=A0A1L0AZ65_9ASCO|nr:uncharacterized protein HGUI_01036 [Hanseniaspora guilliermondii]